MAQGGAGNPNAHMMLNRRLSAFLIFPLQLATAFSPPLNKKTAISIPNPLSARRNRNGGAGDDGMDWYGDVGDNSTPDQVFWSEMERQRLQNKVSGIGAGDTMSNGFDPVANINGGGASSSSSVGGASSSSTTSTTPPLSSTTARSTMNPTMEEQKSAEATLQEYGQFMIADNWLDEDLVEFFSQSGDDDDQVLQYIESLSVQEQSEYLEQQLEELEERDGDGSLGSSLMGNREPWDDFFDDDEEEARMTFSSDGSSNDFTIDDDDEQQEQDFQNQEAEFLQRVSKITTISKRLESARQSPKAKAFFSRPPNRKEGYDRLWVSAIDNAMFRSLTGNLRNYGIEFADNFGDFEDQSDSDKKVTIEDMAAFKARSVYNVTGLPCIAARTSFDIEPVPPPEKLNPGVAPQPRPGSNAAMSGMGQYSPRVMSGYRINDIGNHVDYLCDALRPLSEPSRVTRFKSCLCFYDGETEIVTYGILDCDMEYANSVRTYIPLAQAVTEMIQTVQLTFGLEYQGFLKQSMDHARYSSGGASMKLRDRVLKDGKVLPNDIIDVSAFMDSQVDVNLMDDCAKELANRFMTQKPSKILTVATTGLVIALPMAKYLQVPVVYARKERNVVMADTFSASFSSKTVGKNRELLVSKNHLHSKDRVLIVDDFLSSGASQEALLRIVGDSKATAVGVGVLLEKVYESGRQSLSGFNIPVESLCRVASVQYGSIQLVEEEGYDQSTMMMAASSSSPSSSSSSSSSKHQSSKQREQEDDDSLT